MGPDLPDNSLVKSLAPYQRDRFRLRQNFFETFSTEISVSDIYELILSIRIGIETLKTTQINKSEVIVPTKTIDSGSRFAVLPVVARSRAAIRRGLTGFTVESMEIG